jgi:hypothetical protein
MDVNFFSLSLFDSTLNFYFAFINFWILIFKDLDLEMFLTYHLFDANYLNNNVRKFEINSSQ